MSTIDHQDKQPDGTRICIGQLVRPDGTVLTEGMSPEQYGPTFGPDPRDLYSPYGPPSEPVYGRWRYAGEGEWRVTHYWPNGPGSLPVFIDLTGEGRFHSMNPADRGMERDETARQLTAVTPAESQAS